MCDHREFLWEVEIIFSRSNLQKKKKKSQSFNAPRFNCISLRQMLSLFFCFGAEVWNPSTTLWRSNWKLVMVWPASCTARCHTEWAIGLQIPFKALWITVPFKWGHLPLSPSHHGHWCGVRGMKKRGQTKGLYRWRLPHSHLHVDSLKLSLRGHKIEQINHYLEVAVLVGSVGVRMSSWYTYF